MWYVMMVIHFHAQCDTATVTITVDPVNDPPIAVDDVTATNEDTPVVHRYRCE